MRVPLPEELQGLVRDVVQELDTAADGLGTARTAPDAPVALERRLSIPAAASGTILRLPPRTPEGGAPAPRRRAYLVHLDIPVSVHVVGHPVRLRRLGIPSSPAQGAAAAAPKATAGPIVEILAPEPVALALLALPTPSSVDVAAGEAALVEPPAPADLPAEAGAARAIAVDPSLDTDDKAAAVPSPARQPSRLRSHLGHALNLAIAAVLTLVLVCCIGVAGLVVSGHHIEQVVTGSMQPNIPIGSLVVSERVPANQLVVGDVLLFPNPNNASEIIVHRIFTLRHDGDGNVLITTKGDFNAAPDNWTVKRAGAAYADAGRWVVPGGGVAADWLRRIGFFGLLGLVIGVIGYQGYRQVRKVLATEAPIQNAVSTSATPSQLEPAGEQP